MPNIPQLIPKSNFPEEAIQESVQVQPDANSAFIGGWLTLSIASVADQVTPWGKNVQVRDRQLRDFWPTEAYLAGAVANVSFRNAAFDWEIKSSDKVEQAVTEMLMSAIGRDKIGWGDFIKCFSQDLYTQDNGAFIELIRDPSVGANSRFKDENAPVIGIAHLDSGACVRTGNAEYPVIYTDRDQKQHKLKWYEVIPFSDYPSAIEKMNGVGYCSVTRTLRLAQIMRSIELFKDEKIGGRHFKSIHIVSGVSRTELEDAKARGKEQADNRGQIRYIDPVILASLDPEKPVSTATIDLASLPDGFDLDQELQWYISGLALNLGVDYQDLAPLPGGNIGSGAQSNMLHRKSSGKGPRNWMNSIVEGFTNYGVLPRNAIMSFNDKNEQEELERQEIRTKAMEEAAIAARSKIFPREYIAKDLVSRGIYKSLEGIPPEFWDDQKQAMIGKDPVGQRGGNTIAEDAGRQDSGKPKETAGGRLRKFFGNPE